MGEKEVISTIEVFNPLEAAAKAEDIEIPEDELENLDIEDDKSDDKLDLTKDDTEDDTEDDIEEEESKKKEEPKDDLIEEPVKFSDEYKEAKSQINSLSEKIQDIVEEMDILKPEKPKDMDDEDEVELYNKEMREYNKQTKLAQKRIERFQDRVKDQVMVLQGEFAENHKNEDLSGFESWMQKRKGFLAEFLSGQEDLETFYFLYKKRTGGTKLAQVKKITKGNKEVDISSASVDKGESRDILPKQYKFANKPMFRNYVKELTRDMKAGKPTPNGEPITYSLINKLCEQEYKLNNLKQYE